MPSRFCLTCGSHTNEATRGRCPTCHATHHRQTVYHTRAWARTRTAAITAAGGVCVDCNQPARPGDPLAVDHVNGYEYPYDQTTLKVRHRSCHGRRHGKQGHAA